MPPFNNTEYNPWQFFKDPQGHVLLCLMVQGTMVPTLGFTRPEAFKEFIDDAHRAYIEFVPAPVRDAMEIVAEHSKGEDNNGETEEHIDED